jgi:hypothetical protein
MTTAQESALVPAKQRDEHMLSNARLVTGGESVARRYQ